MGINNKTPLNAWECYDPSQKDVHYLRISKSLLCSTMFVKLGYSARLLYVYMAEACAGKFEFSFAYGDYKKIGFTKTTFLKAKKELIDGGFLKVKKCGKTNRTPNIYQWCFDWKKSEQE